MAAGVPSGSSPCCWVTYWIRTGPCPTRAAHTGRPSLVVADDCGPSIRPWLCLASLLSVAPMASLLGRGSSVRCGGGGGWACAGGVSGTNAIAVAAASASRVVSAYGPTSHGCRAPDKTGVAN